MKYEDVRNGWALTVTGKEFRVRRHDPNRHLEGKEADKKHLCKLLVDWVEEHFEVDPDGGTPTT